MKTQISLSNPVHEVTTPDASTVVVLHTDFNGSKTFVKPDGSRVRIKFEKVSPHSRDPLVRVYVRTGGVLSRVGSGRYLKLVDSALVVFTTGLPGTPAMVDVTDFGTAFKAISPNSYDLILRP